MVLGPAFIGQNSACSLAGGTTKTGDCRARTLEELEFVDVAAIFRGGSIQHHTKQERTITIIKRQLRAVAVVLCQCSSMSCFHSC